MSQNMSRPAVELLAPAGGLETLRTALAAGADAIFCGVGSSFNARRGAGNFELPVFAEACREAHLAGKVAAALMAKAGELFSEPPTIEKVDVLAAKLPS